MAQLDFYVDSLASDHHINNLSGSGLGFYGASFGASVAVGAYQDTTFVTDSNGTTNGGSADNVKWLHASSGQCTSGSIHLHEIPNKDATLNIRFTNATAVKTQNTKLRIYDRVSINNDPSGVVCWAASIIHPWTATTPSGSGSLTWTQPRGSSVILSLTDSPGMSGLSPNGSNTTETRHDYYVALSASPSTVGSKLFALYVSLEYL